MILAFLEVVVVGRLCWGGAKAWDTDRNAADGCEAHGNGRDCRRRGRSLRKIDVHKTVGEDGRSGGGCERKSVDTACEEANGRDDFEAREVHSLCIKCDWWTCANVLEDIVL